MRIPSPLILLLAVFSLALVPSSASAATPLSAFVSGPDDGFQIGIDPVTHGGAYTLTVNDMGADHNFHLTGPGLDPNYVKTGVAFVGTKTYEITLQPGSTYHYQCDPHASMGQQGDFTVPLTPVPLTLPAISGTTTTGATLTCSQGTWDLAPTSYAYGWREDGIAIPGETSNTHVVAVGDGNETLTCSVTATNDAGPTTAVSDGLAIPPSAIRPAAPKCSATASYVGTKSTLIVTWKAVTAVPAVASYEASMRVHGSGTYEPASTAPGLHTTVSFAVTPGKTYDYHMHAVDTAGAVGDYCAKTITVPKTNTVHGTKKGDVLRGWAGIDILFGLKGNDTLWGGKGHDTLDGGVGNDTIHADDDHKGGDIVKCGKGKDTVLL